MKKHAAGAALCVLLLMGLAAFPAAADYGPTVVGGTSSNAERKLAVAPNGTIYATYTEPVGNTTGIKVQQSTDAGASWTALPRLGVAEAFRPCLVVDREGVLHVAWTEFVGPDRQVFYAHWQGGPAWTGLQQMSDTPGYSGFPSLAVDDENGVHLAWYGFDGSNYQIYYRFHDSAGWTATVQATHGAQDANNPSLAVNTHGIPAIAYYSYVRGDLDVWYVEQGPHGWTTPKRINAAGAQAADPSLAFYIDAPVVAFSTGANVTLAVRFAERDLSGNWTCCVAVSGSTAGAAHPSLVTDPATGNVAILYEAAGEKIQMRARVDGQWGQPSTLTSSQDAQWVSALWVPWGQGALGGKVVALWTEGNSSAFHVQFGTAAPFPEPPCKCGGLDLSPWAVPLLFVLIAGSCVGALAIASARTRGGGRG